MAFNGHSRDSRPDKKQIVIGVVTSYEGYPLKHYVFEGITKDETTVGKVVGDLKRDYHIEETIFVGDRGMITRLNLERIEAEQFDYIMGVKHRQDEMMPMVLEDPGLFRDGMIDCSGLKISNRHIRIKDFLTWKISRVLELSEATKKSAAWQDFETFIMAMRSDKSFDKSIAKKLLEQVACKEPYPYRKVGALFRKYHERCEKTIRIVCALNPERAQASDKGRQEKIASLSTKLDKVLERRNKDNLEVRLEKVFEGYNRRYRRFFKWVYTEDQGNILDYQLDDNVIKKVKKFDGIFMLTTTREDLTPATVVKEFKRFQEVESLFDDLKHFVDIHPVRHRLEHRVRAHVFLCILALLNKRVFEIDCLGNKTVTEPLETVATSKLVNYTVRMSKKSPETKTFWKVTNVTPGQQRCYNLVGIKNPSNLENYLWGKKA